MSEEEEESVAEIPEKKVFKLDLHSLLDEMQTSHGLDYHGYCTRRLSRLRHAQDVKRDLVHSSQYVSSKKTKRNAFCQRTMPPQQVTHENVFLVVLLEAERAWAQATEIKGLLLLSQIPKGHEKSKASSGSIRQHALKKLKKSKKHAEQLEAMIQEYGDDTTKQEAKAYAAWMSGNLALEKGQWKSACNDLGLSIQICQQLAADASNNSNLESRDLFTNRSHNVLKPLYKYALYEYKESGGSLDELQHVVVEDDKQQQQQQASDDGDIVFRHKLITVENKTLKVLLLKIDGMLATSGDDDDDKLMQLLSAYDDAIHLVQSDLAKTQQLKAGPSVNAKKEELNHLLSYVQNGKLQLLIKRHELRIQASTESSELAHLYHALLQDAKQVCDLPGEEEDEFWLQANAYVLWVRAFRCYHVGHLYAAKKPAEAMALWKHATMLATRASEEIAACEDMDERYLDELEQLERNVEIAALRLQAQAYLGGSTSSQKGGLLANLDNDNVDASMSLAELEAIPIPCKPSFFDVALNQHASQFPMDEIQKHIDDNKPQASSVGIMGWFRSS